MHILLISINGDNFCNVLSTFTGVPPNPTFQSQQGPPFGSFQSSSVPGPANLVSQTSQPSLEVGRPVQLGTQTSQTGSEMVRPTQPVTQTSNDEDRSNELEQMDTDVSNDQRAMDTEEHVPDSPQVRKFIVNCVY